MNEESRANENEPQAGRRGLLLGSGAAALGLAAAAITTNPVRAWASPIVKKAVGAPAAAASVFPPRAVWGLSEATIQAGPTLVVTAGVTDYYSEPRTVTFTLVVSPAGVSHQIVVPVELGTDSDFYYFYSAQFPISEDDVGTYQTLTLTVEVPAWNLAPRTVQIVDKRT